jgi:hypothetical protein
MAGEVELHYRFCALPSESFSSLSSVFTNLDAVNDYPSTASLRYSTGRGLCAPRALAEEEEDAIEAS